MKAFNVVTTINVFLLCAITLHNVHVHRADAARKI